MITGDAKDTAVSIARDVNIFPEEREGEHIKVSRIVTSHCFDDGVMVL
jgi:magnesium-transporting ATPase (P-type)